MPTGTMRCPMCGRKIRFRLQDAGRDVQCPACGENFTLAVQRQPAVKATPAPRNRDLESLPEVIVEEPAEFPAMQQRILPDVIIKEHPSLWERCKAWISPTAVAVISLWVTLGTWSGASGWAWIAGDLCVVVAGVAIATRFARRFLTPFERQIRLVGLIVGMARRHVVPLARHVHAINHHREFSIL